MSEPMWPTSQESRSPQESVSEEEQFHIHPISGKKCFGRLLKDGDRIGRRDLQANSNGNWEELGLLEWDRLYKKEDHGLVIKPILPLDLN